MGRFIFRAGRPRFSANRRAAVAVITGMTLPILLGAAGFAVDAGFWFAQHAALQAAADAGAMAAARDLESNPATSAATLHGDALAAANAAAGSLFAITLSTSNPANNLRQVEANVSAPARLFFSPAVHMGAFTIHASAVAGVAFHTISQLAACQALDDFAYVYSTGFGTLETAHSAGIDPYMCGSAPPAPPLPPDTYCNGGVTACLLQAVTNLLGVNVGGSLLPVAFQVEPNGSGGGIVPALSSALATIPTLLGGATASSTGPPAVFQQGSANCPGNVCTINAGVYPGGIVIGPGVTFQFATSGSGAGNNYFLLLNGNLVISTQAKLSGANNFIFFMLGAQPGGYVEATQVQVNLSPVASGAVNYVSTAGFGYSSLLGAQISAPISAMKDAQTSATQNGLLGLLGLPGGNLAGTNYETMVATCPQATATCTNPSEQPAQFQTALLPSLNAVTSATLPALAALLPGTTPLTSVISKILSSSGEQSSTVITSDIAVVNGVPTDWLQQETQTGALNNGIPPLLSVLTSVGNLLGSLLNILFPNPVTVAVENVYNAVICTVGGCSLPNPAIASGSGWFAGQTGGNATSCGSSANLFAGSASITPNFGPVVTTLTNDSTNPSSGTTVALTVTDQVTICGTESQSIPIAQIMPGKVMTASTAAGASTLALVQ